MARNVDLLTVGRPEVDLENIDSIREQIASRKFDCVVNAAAYTAVDLAEEEPDRAMQINGDSVGRLAALCSDYRTPLVHISTDYVFDGLKIHGAYSEADRPAPRTAYGVSKLRGENLALKYTNAMVVRTAWVFDATGRNFVRTMLRLAESSDRVRVVADQHGCPTYADDLADAILDLSRTPRHGIYHCAGDGVTTWADFAEEIFRLSRDRGGPYATVDRIPSAEFLVRAARPSNSSLDCGKLEIDYGVRLRNWRDALAECMDEIALVQGGSE